MAIAPVEHRARRWRRIKKAAVVSVAAFLILIGAVTAWVVLLGPLPLTQAREVSTSIIDRNGKLLRAYAMADGRWRLPVDAKTDVDTAYLKLLLAFEDQRFRTHAGVDPLALARAAFMGAPGTLRHPYPRAWLMEALTRVVQAGPAEAADSLLGDAVRGRPGWSTLHELRAFAALRVGRCDVAVKEFLLLLDFGIERDDGPDLVMRCRRGLKL